MPAIAAELAHDDEVRVLDLGGGKSLASEAGHEDRIGRAVGRKQFEHGGWFE